MNLCFIGFYIHRLWKLILPLSQYMCVLYLFIFLSIAVHCVFYAGWFVFGLLWWPDRMISWCVRLVLVIEGQISKWSDHMLHVDNAWQPHNLIHKQCTAPQRGCKLPWFRDLRLYIQVQPYWAAFCLFPILECIDCIMKCTEYLRCPPQMANW